MSAPVIVLNRAFYAYFADDTNTYTVATLVANGNAQSVAATPIAPDLHPRFPVGFVMRKAHCEYTSGGVTYRTVVPIFSSTDTIWTGVSTTLDKFSQTWNIVSRIGERRIYRS